jgi:hypothetical protein
LLHRDAASGLNVLIIFATANTNTGVDKWKR